MTLAKSLKPMVSVLVNIQQKGQSRQIKTLGDFMADLPEIIMKHFLKFSHHFSENKP